MVDGVKRLSADIARNIKDLDKITMESVARVDRTCCKLYAYILARVGVVDGLIADKLSQAAEQI